MSRTHFSAYGLGWGLDDFDGYKRVSHGGGLPGMLTYTNLLPELDLGVIVLTNQESLAAMSAIAYQILKAYTGAEKRDWVTVFAELMAKREAEAAEEVAAALATAGSDEEAGPTLPLAAYAGDFSAYARSRGWRHLRIVSAADSDLKRSLGFEDEEGAQTPGVSVFRRRDDGGLVHVHSVSAMPAPGQFRGMDLLSPFWHFLDFTPEGRGDFMPRRSYEGSE
ncbi:MAG: DUF899 family protein [Myxococcota bacterium]